MMKTQVLREWTAKVPKFTYATQYFDILGWARFCSVNHVLEVAQSCVYIVRTSWSMMIYVNISITNEEHVMSSKMGGVPAVWF